MKKDNPLPNVTNIIEEIKNMLEKGNLLWV
jgi:hypothetical protein